MVLHSMWVHQQIHNIQINSRAEIINVGNKTILPSLRNELIEQPAVLEGLIEVSVTGRIPRIHVAVDIRVLSDGQETVSRDARVARLIEGVYFDLETLVFPHDLLRVLVGVERIH